MKPSDTGTNQGNNQTAVDKDAEQQKMKQGGSQQSGNQGQNIQRDQANDPNAPNQAGRGPGSTHQDIQHAGSQNQRDAMNQQSTADKHSAGARDGSNQQRAEAGQQSGKDSDRSR